MSSKHMSLARFIVNVEVAIYRDGLWLIIKRPDSESHAAGMLSFVGGKVELTDPLSDTLESAARREVLEEVGGTVSELVYIQSTMFSTAMGNTVIDIVFLCSVGADFRPIVTEEAVSVMWLSPEQIASHPSSPPWLTASIQRCVLKMEAICRRPPA